MLQLLILDQWAKDLVRTGSCLLNLLYSHSHSIIFFYCCLLEFNCLTVDPNKDRREAVKRKTTQYLKRAEEIFITHLQDNLGKGNSYLGVRQFYYFTISFNKN